MGSCTGTPNPKLYTPSPEALAVTDVHIRSAWRFLPMAATASSLRVGFRGSAGFRALG